MQYTEKGHSEKSKRHECDCRGVGMLTMALEDAENLAAGDAADLRDTVRISENDADLGRSQTLLRELADVLVNLRALQRQGATG